MNIKVLGSGCSTCKRLLKTVNKIVKETGLDAEVEYITDVEKIVALGVTASPVLVIDDNPVLVGGHHTDEEIEKVIKEASTKSTN